MTDLVRQLATPAGRLLLAELARVPAGSDPLQLADRLRRDHPAELVRAALAQHQLRRLARAKFTRADRMLFTRPGLEQATAEPLARHRAVRYAGYGRLADLCCGIGGDLIALAGDHPVLAVDRDPFHLAMAIHNAHEYGVGGAVSTRTADVQEVDLTGVDAVFVDPARRAGTRRLFGGAGDPPLDWCVHLAGRLAAVGIKTAPGIPHETVPAGWEVELVAHGRDLKEAVLWSPALAGVSRRATVLPAAPGAGPRPAAPGAGPRPAAPGAGPRPAGAHTLVPGSGQPVPVARPGAFLLDPNPAVTRAGLVADLARQLDAWQIDRQIAFLSTDTERHTPFARTLRVAASARWHEREFAHRLRALDVGAVDIRRRGLAGDVDQIRRRLKLAGRHRATLVITRVDDRPWGLICFDTLTP